MNRDGGAYNLPTTYDRILVTCLSSMSRDHMPDKVRGRRVAIRYRFCVWLCNMTVFWLRAYRQCHVTICLIKFAVGELQFGTDFASGCVI